MQSAVRTGAVCICCLGLMLSGTVSAQSTSDQQFLTRIEVPEPPTQLLPYQATVFLVRVLIGADGFDESSARVHYRIDGNEIDSSPLERIFGGYYFATLPAIACPGQIEYFISARSEQGREITVPSLLAPEPFLARTDISGLVPLFEVRFDDGLPPGWTATGLWTVTSACSATSLGCEIGAAWAYFGQPGTCSYDTGFRVFGTLQSAPFQLPDTSPGEELRLEYCMRKVTEDNPAFDLAELRINGVLVDVPPDTLSWTRRSIDLADFAGLSVVLRWQFDTVDDIDNDYLGWQIGSVSVQTIGRVCPVRLGDMNCDGEVDFNDFSAFVSALVSPAVYAAAYPGCEYLAGDFTGDLLVQFDDIDPFIRCLTAGGICE